MRQRLYTSILNGLQVVANRDLCHGVLCAGAIFNGGPLGEQPDPEEPEPLPLARLYAAVDNQLQLAASDDGETGFYSVPTGTTIATSEVLVKALDNGALVHWVQTALRIRLPGDTEFTLATGLPAESPVDVIFTGTEYLAFTYLGVYVATAPTMAFTSRAAFPVLKPTMRGDTIIGISGPRTVAISLDRGATFNTYNIGTNFASFEGMQITGSTSTHFVIAGMSDANAVVIATSTTGADGSWTFGSHPSSSIPHAMVRHVAYDIIFMIMRDGTTWATDDNTVPSWYDMPVVPYAGANTYVPPPNNKMTAADDVFYFGANQGGGVNKIYRFTFNDANWVEIYTAPAGNAIDSLQAVPAP